MLCCYIDESTAFGEKDPATCVAGYVATGKQWAKFSGAWNYLLRHYKVEIFHAKEFETEEGRRHSVYKRWSKKKRNEFQNGIIDIINGSGLKDLGAAIPASVYKAVMTQERIRTFGKTPDAVCALLCMLSAGGFAWAQEGVYKQAPSFIVEAGGNYGHMLRRVHKYLITESEYRD